jgi:hypothetical protein
VQRWRKLSRPNTYSNGLPHALLKPQGQNTNEQNVDGNEGKPRLTGGGCEVIREGYATEEVEDDFRRLINGSAGNEKLTDGISRTERIRHFHRRALSQEQ